MKNYRSEKELKDIIADQAEQIMELRVMVEFYKNKVDKYEVDIHPVEK